MLLFRLLVFEVAQNALRKRLSDPLPVSAVAETLALDLVRHVANLDQSSRDGVVTGDVESSLAHVTRRRTQFLAKRVENAVGERCSALPRVECFDAVNVRVIARVYVNRQKDVWFKFAAERGAIGETYEFRFVARQDNFGAVRLELALEPVHDAQGDVLFANLAFDGAGVGSTMAGVEHDRLSLEQLRPGLQRLL